MVVFYFVVVLLLWLSLTALFSYVCQKFYVALQAKASL